MTVFRVKGENLDVRTVKRGGKEKFRVRKVYIDYLLSVCLRLICYFTKMLWLQAKALY